MGVRCRRRRALPFVAALTVLAGCLGTDAPTEPTATTSVALQPALIPSAADASAQPVNRIRTVTTSWPEGTVLSTKVFEVSPSDPSWQLDILVSATSEGEVVVYLYLIHVDGEGVETVEFSGRTDPFGVTRGELATPEVPFVRGPLANRFVTAVTITSSAAPMAVSESRALTAAVSTSSTDAPSLYWTSLDTGVVALVDSTATAVAFGTARIVASAGAFADTVTIVVAPPDATPPIVLGTLPVAGASNVGVFASITATFDEPLDPTTVTGATFTLSDAVGLPVAGTVTYAATVATFDPAAALDTLATYTATITTGVRDVFGNALAAPYTWSFTTTDQPVRVVTSFNSGLGVLVAIGLDPQTGNLFIYDDFATSIYEFTPTGTQVPPAIPNPGAASNDHDFDFLLEDANIGGTAVPAGALLVMNGEMAPSNTIYAVDEDTGAILATLVTTLPNPVGMSYHTGRNTFFAVDWVDDLVRELDPATGVVLNSFPVAPSGAPAWDTFYGDVEVDQETGRLLLVSSSQAVVRILTPTGAFVTDYDVGGAGVTSMSGIAWDDVSWTAWISTTQGAVYQVDGIVP